MPRSQTKNRARAVKAERFRSNVRQAVACPTCEAPKGYFCKSEETGEKRIANHRARVEKLVGYSLDTVAWSYQAANAKRRHRARNLDYVEMA